MTELAAGDDGALGFPDGFTWGASTAAYQIEGAATADGRGPSVWDTFSHTPGKVRGGDTGDVACDSYHRYREDVALLASLGLSSYRFSISWPRVQPGGRGAVNQRGLGRCRLITDGAANGIYLGPVLHGRYPEHAPAALLPPAALIADGDMDIIKAPLDFLGVNYYSPVFLRAGDPGDLRRNENPARCKLPGVGEYLPPELDRTPMGWLVDPSGLHQILVEVSRQAPGLPLYVTENGCAAEDYVNPDGEVNDLERVRYLHAHLEAAARAIKDGANLAGYFVWSLLDNFEWGWGYQKRFGIVFVDFGTQRRIPKASAAFYANVVQANAIPLLPAAWPR